MDVKKKYFEGEIRKIHPFTVYSGNVYTQKIDVTVAGRDFSFFDPNMLIRKELEGKRTKLYVRLMGDFKADSIKKLHLEQERELEFKVSGRIVGLSSRVDPTGDNYIEGYLDCGIMIFSFILGVNEKFKIGDFVTRCSESNRADITKVEEL